MEYKRLTKKHEIYDIYIADCKACGNHCRRKREEEKGVGKLCDVQKGKRLVELEDKIDNGTLIELPCKVGDTIYYVNEYRPTPRIEEYEVHGFIYRGDKLLIDIGTNGCFYDDEVFLVKKQAEKRLAELQQNQSK